MPHVTFVPLTGFRIREDEMRELGMSLPGLRQRAAAIGQLPALGLLTLAGMTPPPWNCSYRDLPDVTPEGVEALAEEKPDLVAVSALTASAVEAYRLGDELRRRRIPCIIGGLHATACPDECGTHFDAVVVGEGESVWPLVLADASSGELKPCYSASRPFDLSTAPIPRFDLLGGERPRLTIQTQRGCPLACEFCGASRLLGPFREKPAALVRAELAAVAERSPRPVLELADDNTFAGGRDPGPLLAALRASGARWFTEVDWRVGERPDVLRDLAAAGCVQVLVGFESMVFRHPGMGPKQAEMARMMDAVRAIQAAGVAVIGCFIVGSDGETRGSMDRLAAFLDDAPMADVQLTIETPFPATPLYRRLMREGRLLGRDWDAYTLFDVVHRPDRMTPEELTTGFRELVRGVFAKGPSDRRRAGQAVRPPHQPRVPRDLGPPRVAVARRSPPWPGRLERSAASGNAPALTPPDHPRRRVAARLGAHPAFHAARAAETQGLRGRYQGRGLLGRDTHAGRLPPRGVPPALGPAGHPDALGARAGRAPGSPGDA